MGLSTEQEQKILEARPDVAAHDYYGKNVEEWWKKHGKEEMGQQVLTTRPDVAAHDYYGSNPAEWYLKYGLDANEVLSAPNVKKATTTPQARPDDLLKIRSGIQEQLEIPSLQKQYQEQMTTYNQMQTNLANKYQEVYNQYLDKETAMEAAEIAISGQPLSIGKILGQQAQERKLSAAELAAMGRGMESMAKEHEIQLGAKEREVEMLGAQLQSAQAEAESRFDIKSQDIREMRNYMMQYPSAGITFTDTYPTMAKKVADAQVKERDEERIYELQSSYPGADIDKGMDWEDALKKVEKYQEKQISKEAFTDVFGYYPDDLSSKEVKKKLEKYYESERDWLEEQRSMERQEFEYTINKPYYQSDSGDDEYNEYYNEYIDFAIDEAGKVDSGEYSNKEIAKQNIDAKFGAGSGDVIDDLIPNVQTSDEDSSSGNRLNALWDWTKGTLWNWTTSIF